MPRNQKRKRKNQGNRKNKKRKIEDYVEMSKYDLREETSLKQIKGQKGFEKETKVLSEVEFKNGKTFVEGEQDTEKKNKFFAENESREYITPFNLKEEREMGNFDEQTGNFSFERDVENRDFWADHLEDIEINSFKEKRNQIKKPKKQEIEQKEKTQKEQEQESIELIKLVLNLLKNEKETVSQAIKRLKSTKEKSKEFNTLTTTVSKLLATGLLSLFDQSKQELYQKIKKLLPEVRWEYKLLKNEKIFGDFSTEQIRNWIKKGFFKEDNVVLRIKQNKENEEEKETQNEEEKLKKEKESEFLSINSFNFYAYK